MISRLTVAKEVVITGGGAKNIGLVKALSDSLGCPLLVPPEPLLTGAIGAALIGREIIQKNIRDRVPSERIHHSLEEVKFFK
jgi:activator of 2-hydroxyglutaryl-CoA dehydratase